MVRKGWDSIFSKCLTFNGDEPLEGMIRLPFQPADLCEWRHLATFENLVHFIYMRVEGSVTAVQLEKLQPPPVRIFKGKWGLMTS